MIQFFNNFLKYKYLMGQLVKKNIKLRYRRSYLGMLWTLIEPLLTMIVLSVVFGSLLGRNSTDAAFAGVPFPIYVLTGRLLYSFFSSATNSAMRSIRTNGAMIKKVYVPKYIYPFSGILANFIIFLISLVVLVGVMVFFLATGQYHAPINGYMVMTVIPLLNLFILSTGVGMILSTLCVFFRDIQHIYNAVLTAWMYLTPLFYPITLLPEALRKLVMTLNPMYFYITQFRQIVLECRMPDSYLIIAGFVAAGIALLVGVGAFLKTQDKFILYI